MTPERSRKIRSILQRRQPDLTVLMDNVGKPHNLGAIARTCDSIGIGEVHAVTDEDWYRLGKKVAIGSYKYVSARRYSNVGDACADLRQRGFRLLAAHLDEAGVDYREVDYTQPTALLMGAELDGISQEALDEAEGTIFIPTVGMVESLNVSVAAALILYEAFRQRTAAGMYEERRLDEETYQRLLFEWGHPKVAAYHRKKGLPYPKVGEDGEILIGSR